MAYKTSPLRHLGNLSGLGAVQQHGKEIARASYDFDGYYRERVGVTCNGEIQASPDVLQQLFGQPDLQLLTEQGRLLDFNFSDKALPAESDVAHVDVTGNLPVTPDDWRH
jgi:hypothetical protein